MESFIDFVVDDRLRRFFWKKVNKAGPVVRPDLGPCWEWTGAVRHDGYGVRGTLLLNGKRRHRPPHRIAFALEYAWLPPPTQVLRHECDNRRCVRPTHLKPGTHKENAADMVSRGRQRKGDQHHARSNPENLARGEETGTSKLTEADVIAIRAEYQPYKGEAKRLEKKYGVTNANIIAIVKNKQWKHLPPAPIYQTAREAKPLTRGDVEQLILANVKYDEASGCVFWTGGCGTEGYPHIVFAGMKRGVQVRRLVYEAEYNVELPENKGLYSQCRNKLCVNPEHLVLKENLAPGEVVFARPDKAGSKHHKAKVTEENVRQMRADFATGQFTRQQIADKYGLKLPQTCAILNRIAWRHVA